MGIVEAKNLTFEYIRRDEEGNVEGITTAVDNVNIDIKAGDFVAVLGHNGSGKSTFAKHLNALVMPTEGTVYVDGMDTKDSGNTLSIRQTAGMVFQNPDNQIVGTLVDEEVGFGPENIGVPTEEIWERVEKSLKAVGMYQFRSASPNKLSGGQKQRVAIARVLASDPEILLCDEATSALDPQTTKSILELIRKINKEYGITVVVITHEMSVVQEICNRVAVLERGVLVESGTVEELFRSPKTEAARRLVFSGRAQIQKMNGKRLVRVTFKDKSSFEPVIANLVLTYRTPVNILYADTKNIGGSAEGEMILQLPEIEETAEKMIEYLRETNMGVEELSFDVG